MKHFFEYNWQKREEWFDWCEKLSEEQLWQERVGGVGSIGETLLHIVGVEYSWICDILEKTDEAVPRHSLAGIRTLSNELRPEIVAFLTTKYDPQQIVVDHGDRHTIDAILHHIIIHEIHHIGQLSVWARELHLAPISANYVREHFPSLEKYFEK
ncbi:DinB family protein [Kurthia populi]|uniref:DinB family protein n=1 Tax=Kurthia populi TaxID=1562132 RepID=A0ABW5Y043_9BACL